MRSFRSLFLVMFVSVFVCCAMGSLFAQGIRVTIPMGGSGSDGVQTSVVIEHHWYSPQYMVSLDVLKLAGIPLLLLLGYLGYAGFCIGKGRSQKASGLRVAPPEGFSPAAARMAWRMGFDMKTLAAALTSLAVKRALTLGEDGADFVVTRAEGAALGAFQDALLTALQDGEPHVVTELANAMDTAPKNIRAAVDVLSGAGYAINNDGTTVRLDPTRQPKNPQAGGPLASEEREILDNLFCDRGSIQVVGADKGYLEGANCALRELDATTLQQRYYHPNTRYLTIGIILAIVVTLLTVAAEYYRAPFGLNLGGTAFLVLPFLLIIGRIIPQWVLILRGRAHRPGVMAGWMILGTVICCAFIGVGISMLERIPLLILLAVTLTVWGNMWLARRLRVPTPEGARLIEELNGFRQFLQLPADQARMGGQGPARSPKLFEEYLPYALALDAEREWAEQCSALYAGSIRFAWYEGEFRQLSALTKKLGDEMTYAIEMAISDANAKGTDVARDEDEEEAEDDQTKMPTAK